MEWKHKAAGKDLKIVQYLSKCTACNVDLSWVFSVFSGLTSEHQLRCELHDDHGCLVMFVFILTNSLKNFPTSEMLSREVMCSPFCFCLARNIAVTLNLSQTEICVIMVSGKTVRLSTQTLF